MRRHKNKQWIIIYAIIALLLIAIHYIVELRIFNTFNQYVPFIKKTSRGLFLIALILLISKIIVRIVNNQDQLEGDRYNLLRIVRFLTLSLCLIVGIAFLFQNLLAAAVSFGLISLVLGFALQAPITSFIAWVYLVLKRTYLVGDRIQIKGMRGDVVEINYLDTTLMERSGDYLGNDKRSGRVIRFPNSIILKEEIINYSGPEVPFIWNETPLQIAYTSDIQFVEDCLLKAATMDFKEQYPKLSLNKQWEPKVYFRINAFAWMEAVVSYPADPLDLTGRRNRILKLALPLLNAAPEKVKFPEGTLR